MGKILIGLLAAAVTAVGGYFAFDFYVQHRVASNVDAAFGALRASGAKASHGKVHFDIWTRTITVADIKGESAAQPPVTVKIGKFTALGMNQPEAGRFTADRIETSDVQISGTMAVQGGLRMAYQVPRIEIVDYAGPATPLHPLTSAAAIDVYRFALKHFATVSAKSMTAPTVTAKLTPVASSAPAGAGEYTYSGIAVRDIKDGKVATTTVDRVTFTAAMNAAGKTETLTGEITSLAAYDFDAASTRMLLDPAHAKDDKYYRAYRQLTAGAYTASFEKGLRMRVGGITVDDIGLRPSKLQFADLMAIVDSAPPPGITSTPEQMRDLITKAAGLYDGIRIGGLQVRGIAMETPDGPLSVAAVRLANLENGKIAEFAIDDLEAKAPTGQVKVGRFALKSLDVANMMRVSAQFSTSRQTPAPDQLAGLLLLLEGTEIGNVVAPYKDSNKPVNIETLNLSWGQFVGPVPTRLRATLKMSGPIDLADPDPFRMLAAAGMSSASVNVDLGAAWTESARSFALVPISVEIGGLMSASGQLTLANVAREAFSLNPLQAAIMAAQIEAGPVELMLRDSGALDLAINEFARTQGIPRDAARMAIVEAIRENAMKMATINPDVMALAGAITRFIENPRGTLTIKLTPRGKVSAMQLIEAMKTGPVAALARFEVEATTGR